MYNDFVIKTLILMQFKTKNNMIVIRSLDSKFSAKYLSLAYDSKKE